VRDWLAWHTAYDDPSSAFGVLPDHPRRDDVRAVLVKSDPRNVALARRAAAGRGLPGVEVRQADAGLAAAWLTCCLLTCCCCAASSAM
jgi:hypothetical protein